MEISVLGPVEVSAGGRPVAIGAGKPRALLAMLALHEGSTVTTDRLVEGLWGEETPATAVKMVQACVSQLRRALADAGDGVQILTRGRGYELRLRDGGLDARRFERLIAEGQPRDALALWRGAPLADVADEPFAAPEIRRLEELRLTAIEQAIDRDLAAGRHREVIGELEALVAAEPLRERLHARLMLALYRCGRQSEALEAYGRARRALVEAIGVEPGPELRRMQEAILRQDPSLEPPARQPIELPAELDAGTPLAGREAELDWLREHWRAAHAGAGRLVLVVGVRGIGKTRLAAELASEVHRDRGTVLYASGAGPPATARAALDAARAARRPTLLVLDDVDRASGELRSVLAERLDGLPALAVLVAATGEDPALASQLGVDATLALAPLDADGVAAIARLYVREDADVPVERLIEDSGGVPQRVHHAASEWARTQAARRLGAAAARAASERTDLRAAEDDVAGDVVELQAVSERARLRDSEPGVVACPFKGLSAFDIDDTEIFFGRERLVAEMVARLAGAPLMGIVGPSGSGKSSALRAGLLAALAAGVLPGSQRWALALLRPGEHPPRALEKATGEAAPHGRLIVAVDQFEEAFTACRQESERTAFVDALVACARDLRRRALVLVAVRADFYGRCAAYPELSRLLGANHVLVGPMRRDELRRAIELPARRAGLQVEPELVDALLADVEGEPGALPLLSTSLLELWRHRDGRRLHLAAYEQAGGVRGAVARLAESAYERLDPERRQIARRLLLRLAGEGEGDAVVRRRVGLAELGAERDEAVGQVLSVLAADRLVTIGAGEVEIAHEALLREWPRLRAWLDEDVQGRRLHQHLIHAARDWQSAGRDRAELYRGARLASALDWLVGHEHELNDVERNFIAESRRAAELEAERQRMANRRLRALLASVAVLLALAVVAGVVALSQRGQARDEALVADAQRLGSRALVEPDLDRALLLARQGLALDDSVQTRGNLLAALLRSPAAIGVLRADTERIVAAALSPDEGTLAVGNIPGRVTLFDTRTRRRVATLTPTPNGAAIAELAFSPGGRRLAVAHAIAPGDPYTARPFAIAVTVLDARTHRTVTRLRLPRGRPITGLRFSPDARTIGVMLTSLPDGASAFMRFDARTGRRIVGPVRVNRRGYSPLMTTGDGRRMVVVGDDGVTLRDAATLEVLKRFRGVRLGAALAASSLHSITVSAPYALSSDGRTAALGGADGSLRLLDLRTGAVRTASGRHGAAVSEARFTPDGRRVITTGDDGDVIVWDARRAAATETLSGHAGFVFSPMISRDGATLYTASLDGTVIEWDLLGTRRLGRPLAVRARGMGAAGVALSFDGDVLASARSGGAIAVIDAHSLHERRTVPVLPSDDVARLLFVPGGHVLVVAGDNGQLALLDADSGRVMRLRGARELILTPGASADGRLLVTASLDGTVRLWSLPGGRPVGAPLRFRYGVYDAQLSPGGRRLTVVPFAGPFRVQDTLEVWDVRSRRRIVRENAGANANVVRFSPDGRLVVVGNNNGLARVWSTATWKPVTRSFGPHAGVVSGAAISRDDRTLATGGDDGTVRLWDIPTGQAIGAPLPGLPNRSVVPSFTADGTHLLAAYETGTAYLWDIRRGSLVRQACRVAGRRLTRAEWNAFLPGRNYDPAC